MSLGFLNYVVITYRTRRSAHAHCDSY